MVVAPSSSMLRALLAGLALLAACSPGVGRDPVFSDAAVRADAEPVDAGEADAGARRDAGATDAEVFLPDAGPGPRSVFTGVFRAFSVPEPLYAREVEGRLSLMFGGPPYTYSGNIEQDGDFRLTSAELLRAGCLEAVVVGNYERATGLFELQHRTCTSRLEPVSSDLRGAFVDDYHPERSGIFELETQVVLNSPPCWDGDQRGRVTHAVSFLASGEVAVYTAADLFEPPALYVGRATERDWSFVARYQTAPVGGSEVAISGRFTQVSVDDPLVLAAERDVFYPTRNCTFRVQMSGTRVAPF
jgi:hypothetical protein